MVEPDRMWFGTARSGDAGTKLCQWYMHAAHAYGFAVGQRWMAESGKFTNCDWSRAKREWVRRLLSTVQVKRAGIQPCRQLCVAFLGYLKRGASGQECCMHAQYLSAALQLQAACTSGKGAPAWPSSSSRVATYPWRHT